MNTDRVKAATKSLLRGVARQWRDPARIAESHWGLRRGADGELQLHGVALHRLIGEHGSPLHVVDLPRLERKLRPLQALDVEVFFSYKTNPVPGVLQRLHGLGVGAEVISGYEWWLARRLGVPPSNIIYNGPAKDDASLRDAIASGCLCINANSLTELQRIQALASSLGTSAAVGIRTRVGGGWAGQFGLAAGAQLRQALDYMAQADHLTPVGLHVHRGGQIRTASQAQQHAENVFELWAAASQALGSELPLLNCGGSLATPSVDWLSDRDRRFARTLLRPPGAPDIEACLGLGDYAQTLSTTIKSSCQARGLPPPRVIIEPGRAMTGDVQHLLCSVLDRKPGESEFEYLILDAGINLAESMRSEYHAIFHATNGAAPDAVMRLAGPICTPSDVIADAAALPETAVGDAIVVMDSGAYFVPFSTSFSFPQPAIVGVEGTGEVTVLRRAQSYDDVIQRDAI